VRPLGGTEKNVSRVWGQGEPRAKSVKEARVTRRGARGNGTVMPVEVREDR